MLSGSSSPVRRRRLVVVADEPNGDTQALLGGTATRSLISPSAVALHRAAVRSDAFGPSGEARVRLVSWQTPMIVGCSRVMTLLGQEAVDSEFGKVGSLLPEIEPLIRMTRQEG